MSRGPIIHGVLLVAALAFAYQTWTRDKTVKVDRGEFVLWDGKPGDILSIDYDVRDKRTTHIERRTDEHGGYLWATVTRTTVIPKKRPSPPEPAAPEGLDAGAAPAEPEPAVPPVDEEPPEIKTTTKEFPVGDVGEELFKGLAPMHALRDLGTLDDEQRKEYELAEADTQLTVHFKSGDKNLVLGGKVYGGSHRYAVDSATGKAYIIPGETLQSLAGGDSVLRDGKIFPFEDAEVATATIKTPLAERKLVRGEKEGEHGTKTVTWALAETPGEDDQTLANFMSRVDKLTPSTYEPSMSKDGLTEIMQVAYAGKDGKPLGHLGLFKKPTDREGVFEYYVFSERTRVIAKTHPGAAKRVDKDLEQLFAPPE
jgi:hypothetical protein